MDPKKWNYLSLMLPKLSSLPSKALLFLSFRMIQEMVRGISRSFLFPLHRNSHTFNLSFIEPAMTHLIQEARRPWSINYVWKGQRSRRWLQDSAFSLQRKHLLVKVIPLFTRLSMARIRYLAASQAKKEIWGEALVFQIIVTGK